jgi:hypothetical protein
MDGSQITWSKDNQLNSYSVFEEDGTTPAIGTDYNDITRLDVFFDGAKLSIIASGVSDAIDVELTPFDDISSTNVQDGMEEINTKVNSIDILSKETLAMPVAIITNQWTKETNMDILPDADGWSNTATIDATLNGDGTINIDDNSATNLSRYEINPTVDSTKITRLDIRNKINSSTGTAFVVGVDNGTKLVILSFTGLTTVAISGGINQTIDLTIYNTFRVELDKEIEARLYINEVLVDTVAYANLASSSSNEIRFNTSAGQQANLDIDFIDYQLDLEANPDVITGWELDATLTDFFSAEVTTVNTYLVDDTHLFKPKPVDTITNDSWNNAGWIRTDRVDDNTIKIYVETPNLQAFDFELVIIKDKASIT